MSTTAPSSYGPVKGPPEPGLWTKKDIIDHVKTGMQVELGTLPIYFCALYSIKRDNGGWGTKARASILGVAEQEMLHLALAGNMLRALDATQPLYDKTFMPTYPSQILFEKIDMMLQPAHKGNLECFLKIEAPYMPSNFAAVQFQAGLLPEYNSIGEFYKTLEQGIKEVSQRGPNIFSSNRDMQFRGEEFFDSQMTVVVDTETALQALETIVDQGEGSIGIPESHYTIFVQLYQMRKNWEIIDYIDEPRTDKYKGTNETAYRLSLGVDASFCYLLQTIDRCWLEKDITVRTQMFRNIHRLMIEVLSPLAHVLVQQNVGPDGKHAAPCFEFYPPNETRAYSPRKLYEELTKEVQRAQDAATAADDKAAIAKIMFCLKDLAPTRNVA